MMILPELAAQAHQLTTWRRHIHAHPETAFEEGKTAAFVANKLREVGLDVTEGVAKTGVVGTLRGRSEGPGIVLRADLDALNMTEQNTVGHRSTHQGKMHACGHDGHTIMLLGAARHLAQNPNFAGTVHFVFQPAEEGAGGGRVMVEEGFFDQFPATQVFGMHNWPALDAGRFAIHSGPVMACADRFTIRVTGQGGHAAMPDETRDPIVAAAQLVTALQTISSRSVSPLGSAVISVTQFHAGESFNVIPSSAELGGTTRSLSPEVQDLVEQRVNEIGQGIEKAYGVKVDVDYQRGYPVTVNTQAEAELAAQAATIVVGANAVRRDMKPTMGAEDFSYFLLERPGCYVWIGSGKQGENPGLHHPHFDFNDDVLPIGASYWVQLVHTVLSA